MKTTEKPSNIKGFREIVFFNDNYKVIVSKITPETTIEELNLSVRSFNCLKKLGIETVFDLLNYEKKECYRQLGRISIEEVIIEIKNHVENFEQLKQQCSNKTRGTNECPKKLTLDTPIEELELSLRAYKPLKSEGVTVVRDVFKFLNGTIKSDLLRLSAKEEILKTLRKHNLTYGLLCTSCDTILTEDEYQAGRSVCTNCYERSVRLFNARDIVLDVLPPEKSSYLCGEKGFHIYINVQNNTSTPVKLELKECSIFKNGRQNASNSNLTGYGFTEDYIFPTAIKTFAKIWITDNWLEKDINYSDYLTILLKNSENCQQYYYKFNYSTEDGIWKLTDYYKI